VKSSLDGCEVFACPNGILDEAENLNFHGILTPWLVVLSGGVSGQSCVSESMKPPRF